MEKTFEERSLEFHEAKATYCLGMSGAAYGVGDMLAGESYANMAKFHDEQAANYREMVRTARSASRG